ncbi:MAG: acyl--CoA ligase, partial [Lentisphaeria bacterium]|nr:acyl--CoA ligase [Lentisphaeria bacterium]
MPITEILAENARRYGDDVALVEINPEKISNSEITWREYALIETSPTDPFRSEMTWSEFDRKANRLANFLLTRNIKKGDKVAILLMNSLEWLPIYFGVLRAGAMAVPLNYRYSADEIRYCVDLADVDVLIFGPAFIGRVEEISHRIPRVKCKLYVGEDCPSFAESYYRLTA